MLVSDRGMAAGSSVHAICAYVYTHIRGLDGRSADDMMNHCMDA